MKVRDEAKLSTLDVECDAQTLRADVADEVFAVVDVLDSSAGLRRAFSDPASTAEARVALVESVFGRKISPAAQWVVTQAASLRWRNGQILSDALERQAVRILLKSALDKGNLDSVIAELSDFISTVREYDGLRETLRDSAFHLKARQKLISTLVAGKVSTLTETLLKRAVSARERTYRLTVEGYLHLAAKLRDRQIAHVTVARPLTADQDARLRAALARQTGRAVDLQVEIDPDVLGGICVLFGDDRIESTVAARLEDVQRQLTA